MLTDYRILYLLLIPIAFNAFFLFRTYSIHPNRRWREEAADFNWWEAIISFAIIFVVIAAGWHWGRDMRINDYKEQIGGFISNKYSQDGSHEESYDCNCSTDKDGNRSCSTCWRTVYHTEFVVETNIGDWFEDWRWDQIVDKNCESCALEPHRIPAYFNEAYIGKPVSFDNSYPNYIAAMNEKVYRNTYKGLVSYLPDICPETPDIRATPHSVYKALPLGFQQGSPFRDQIYSWNFANADPATALTYYQQYQFTSMPRYMDTMFGYLGGAVQGDTHIYVVNSTDMAYADMCMAKWRNGAKNSINVFIFGTSDGITYNPTNVSVRLGVDGTKKNSELDFENEAERSNYYMKFDIQNELMTYFTNGGAFDRENVLGIIFNNVNSKFVRQEMATFKALKQYVHPTTGFMIFLAVVVLIIDACVHWFFANNEI